MTAAMGREKDFLGDVAAEAGIEGQGCEEVER